MLTYTHEYVLKLRSALGHAGLDVFANSTEGICKGVAQTAIAAFVLEKALAKEAKNKKENIERQNEFQCYLDRIDFILKHHLLLSRLIADTKENIKKRAVEAKETRQKIEIGTDERKIIEVAALIESMQLFSYPAKYDEIFGKTLAQDDEIEIAYYAQSSELEKIGLIRTDSISGIYTLGELKKYFSLICKHLESHPCDLALGIDNDEHAISLFYDTSSKTWTIIDAEHLVDRNVTSDELMLRIATAFPVTYDVIKIINTKFFTSTNRKDEVQSFVNELKNDNDFILLHETTPERALKTDLKGITLAYNAASNNDAPVIRTLSKLKNSNNELLVDFDKPNRDGTTPLFMAIQNGCIEVIKLLTELRHQNGESVIDFNNICKVKKGTWTPLGLAVRLNQTKVIQLFFELKDSNGNRLIDFNKPMDDMSPFFIAAKFGFAPSLQLLAEFKNPDGSYVVDVNQPMKSSGNTPLYVAVNRGNTNVVKVLANLKNGDGSRRIDLNQFINDDEAAIHIVARNGNVDMLRALFLLRNSDDSLLIDFNKKDKNGSTAIHIASKNGEANIIDFFAEIKDKAKINFNELNHTGLTAAQIAAANNKLRVLIALDNAGININSARGHSNTTQFFAALDKRNQLYVELNMLNSKHADEMKKDIAESFQLDHIKFLYSDEFEDKMSQFKKTTDSSNSHRFFSKDEENSTINTQYQMEFDITEDKIEIDFKFSLNITFEKISNDPLIWSLSVKDIFDKKIKVPISNTHLINQLIDSFKQKNMDACIKLLSEQTGKSYRNIVKTIKDELDTQTCQQDWTTSNKKQ